MQQLKEKYPKLISSDRLAELIDECTKTQLYKTYIDNDTNEKTILERFPNQVDSDSLDKTLKEAEATRKKFSIY